MKKKGCLIMCLFLVITIPLVMVFDFQYRRFYRVGDMVFTVWMHGRYGTFVMPYRYLGLTRPRNDYILADARGAAFIFIGEDRTLYIFPSKTYTVNIMAGECVIKEINLHSHAYVYFPFVPGLANVRAFQEKLTSFVNRGYPFIDVTFQKSGFARIGNVNETRE